jgi:TonB family protein
MGFGFCTSARAASLMRCGALAFAAFGMAAHAQLVPSVGAASAPATDGMERAQRQADNVMRWIKVHADKPRAPAAAPVAPAPVKPPEPLAAKPAPAPKAAVAAPAAPAPAPTPEPAVVVAPEPVAPVVVAPPAPAPVVAKAPPPPPEEEEDTTPLKVLAQPQPEIPRTLLASLTAGKVMIQFTVEPSGKTSNVEILSSANRKLNAPTMAAVSNWRFAPIKKPRTAQIEIDFLPQQ